MSDNVKYLPTKPGLTPLNPEFRNLPSLIRSDDGSRYCQVDLLRHVQPQHIIRRMAEDLAAVSVIPPSSIMVAGMGIFSAALSRMD